MDFGGPQASTQSDPGKLKKLAQRVEQTLNEHVVFKEPKQLVPRSVLVAPHNRDGAPPNVQHVHMTILKSFLTKGFDRTRPQVGICIEYKSDEGRRKLIEHNQRFSKGCSLLPAIDDKVAMYGSLAGSHLNLALRLIQNGASSPAGDIRSLTEGDPSLGDIVMHGHRWWILPENTPVDRQVDISLWRNQDQNENQSTHEIEILQNIVATATDISRTQKTVPMGELIAKACKRTPAKISPTAIQTLAKFFVQFLSTGDQVLVGELVDFHSMRVNPKDLVVSNAFFQALVSEEALQKAPFTRHYILLTQYTVEKSRAQAGGPSIAAFLETQSISQIAKRPDLLKAVEVKIREIRDLYLPLLEKTLSPKEARLELSAYMDLIIRCLVSKPFPPSLRVSLPTGKFSAEKVTDLGVVWAKSVDSKYPDMNFAAESGLLRALNEDDHDGEQVELQNFRALKRTASEACDADDDFKKGDRVTVIRRMSWTIPVEGKADYRKNINEGQQGTIEDWADDEKRQVLLKVNVDLPGGSQKMVTHAVFPRNLQLTKNYDLQQSHEKAAVQAAEKQEKGKKGKAAAKIPEWLLNDSEDPASA